jgi:hypothetical protein
MLPAALLPPLASLAPAPPDAEPTVPPVDDELPTVLEPPEPVAFVDMLPELPEPCGVLPATPPAIEPAVAVGSWPLGVMWVAWLMGWVLLLLQPLVLKTSTLLPNNIDQAAHTLVSLFAIARSSSHPCW